MKLAVSFAEHVEDNEVEEFRAALSRFADDIDFFAPGTTSSQLIKRVNAPLLFDRNGVSTIPDYIKTSHPLPRYKVARALYYWHVNGFEIAKSEKEYDAIFAITDPFSFDYHTNDLPMPSRYGEIVGWNTVQDWIYTSNYEKWIAKRSDYHRLTLGWKFLRYLGVDQMTHQDKLAQKSTKVEDYIWNVWVNVQQVKVKYADAV